MSLWMYLLFIKQTTDESKIFKNYVDEMEGRCEK